MSTTSKTRIEAAIVNYRTVDLTRTAVWSLHTCYPKLPITVVDSRSRDDSARELQKLATEIPTLDIHLSQRNLHHGPGLDLAIRNSDAEWILLFDSDCIAYRANFLELMLERLHGENTYMIGSMLSLGLDGYPSDASTDDTVVPYVHPSCALIRRSFYLQLPPFEKHGTPCLSNEIAALQAGYRLIEFPIRDYVYHIGRGTASRHGYNLGLKGQLLKARRWLRTRAKARHNDASTSRNTTS